MAVLRIPFAMGFRQQERVWGDSPPNKYVVLVLPVAERDTEPVGLKRAGVDEVRTRDLMLVDFTALEDIPAIF